MAAKYLLSRAPRASGAAVGAAGFIGPLRARPRSTGSGRAGLLVPLALLAAYLCLNGHVAVDRYHTPDDGYRRITAYLEANASFGTPIASTSVTDAELLGGPADANLYCLDETNSGAPQPLGRCYGLQHPENGYTITDETLVTNESRTRARIRDPQ